MNKERHCVKYILGCILFLSILINVHAQCNFQPSFNGSSWHDNTKGTLTFGTQYMTGWTFYPFKQTVNQWQCVNSATDNVLVMRTRSSFRFEKSSGSWVFLYGYLCLKLTNITDTSYIYYQAQVQINDIGGERMKLSTLATLDHADVCSDTVSVPSSEYHVLVKSGSEAISAIECPNSLLFTGDYTYTNGTGAIACDTTADVIDACFNTSQVLFNYTTCSQNIAFSAGGVLLCVARVTSGGYDYVTLLNMDTSFTTATSRFACLSTDGNSASVAPGNCTATQTPTQVPTATETDGTTTYGHLLTFTNKYSICGTVTTEASSGLTGGQVAAIVICVLIFVFSLTGFIILVVCLCATKIFLIVLYDISSDSDDMKSPVTLPDIEAKLQDLKLNQENFTNGGPFKRHDRLLIPKVHVHSDGKGKTLLQPLTGRKAGETTFSKTKGKYIDKGSKPLDKGKSMIETEHVKDTLKVPNDGATDAKIDSSRKEPKKDLAKDKVLQTSPKVSPRKPIKAIPVSKVGKSDKSPRNAEESITPRKKENVSDQSPRKSDELQLLSRKSFI